MSTKQIHFLTQHSGAGSIPTLGPHAFPTDLAPLVSREAVFVQVVLVVAVVAAKNIHVRVEDYCGMRMPGARACFWVDRFHEAPFIGCYAKSVEIIYSVVAIIPAEDVDAAIVHDSGVAVSRRGGL